MTHRQHQYSLKGFPPVCRCKSNPSRAEKKNKISSSGIFVASKQLRYPPFSEAMWDPRWLRWQFLKSFIQPKLVFRSAFQEYDRQFYPEGLGWTEPLPPKKTTDGTTWKILDMSRNKKNGTTFAVGRPKTKTSTQKCSFKRHSLNLEPLLKRTPFLNKLLFPVGNISRNWKHRSPLIFHCHDSTMCKSKLDHFSPNLSKPPCLQFVLKFQGGYPRYKSRYLPFMYETIVLFTTKSPK